MIERDIRDVPDCKILLRATNYGRALVTDSEKIERLEQMVVRLAEVMRQSVPFFHQSIRNEVYLIITEMERPEVLAPGARQNIDAWRREFANS